MSLFTISGKVLSQDSNPSHAVKSNFPIEVTECTVCIATCYVNLKKSLLLLYNIIYVDLNLNANRDVS